MQKSCWAFLASTAYMHMEHTQYTQNACMYTSVLAKHGDSTPVCNAHIKHVQLYTQCAVSHM